MSDRSSVDDLDLERVLTPLAKQADDIIEAGTDWEELATELDVSRYERQDPYPEWHAETNEFAPMFLAVLWAKTEDESVTGLSDRLKNQSEIADAFGFDKNEIPHGDTFARTWRNRFEELQEGIERAAKDIDKIATERGSPIGNHTGLESEETDGVSKRTEQRLFRQRTKEVLEQMADVVFPALDLPRPEEAIYSEDDMLELMTALGIEGNAANAGAVTHGDRLDEEKDIDEEEDPFYEDGMTGETLLETIKLLTVERITDMVNRAAERALTRIKPYAEFPDPVFMAIDMTYVAYYGDRNEMEWVTGTPDHKQYDWCHKFATATLVGDGVHMVVGMLPVGNPAHVDNEAYPGSDNKSYVVGDVVRDLLEITNQYVTPRCIYADREFASADTIAAFEEENARYMMPAPRNDRTKRWLERNVDAERGILATEQDWAIYGPVKHGASNERVTTNLVGLPGDPDDEQYGFGETSDSDEATNDDDDRETNLEPVPFYTNTHVDDEIAVDRRQTKKKVERYNKRGGIETAYKKIKEFAAWTTSKEFEVRLWHFGFAVLLYNAWLLVDFLVQVGLDVEFRSKPRITAQRFRNYVQRRLTRLI
ncbi:transposase [Halalkaliarchaeum sp. AArc-GB]|uniref:transposase n=1 Tax=Halalkaliarchaeum sp. AArc-GB TaxID=3074078 RepID=UPI00285C8862|nr:transposase [Halalkaliarchaeum sp. AArc-GB]MDR5672025.1 transposase [Halalkaliarchaeum sp. AArc-GB]